MKPSEGKALIDNCIKRGWVRDGDKLYTPAEALLLNIVPDSKAKRLPKAKRTGWIDDELNIRNKAKHHDQFIQLVKIELNLDVWPEFHFTTERQWRFDYAIPVRWNTDIHNPAKTDLMELKIAIEVEGGIHSNGRHVRGKGYEGDMQKYTMASVNGWTLIRVTPKQLLTSETIETIKKAILCKNVI